MANQIVETKIQNFVEIFCENKSQSYKEGCEKTLKWLNENVGDPFKSH